MTRFRRGRIETILYLFSIDLVSSVAKPNLYLSHLTQEYRCTALNHRIEIISYLLFALTAITRTARSTFLRSPKTVDPHLSFDMSTLSTVDYCFASKHRIRNMYQPPIIACNYQMSSPLSYLVGLRACSLALWTVLVLQCTAVLDIMLCPYARHGLLHVVTNTTVTVQWRM